MTEAAVAVGAAVAAGDAVTAGTVRSGASGSKWRSCRDGRALGGPGVCVGCRFYILYFCLSPCIRVAAGRAHARHGERAGERASGLP